MRVCTALLTIGIALSGDLKAGVMNAVVKPARNDTIGASLGDESLFRARLELELDRRGGPRSDRVLAVFSTSLEMKGQYWEYMAGKCCTERVVSCRALLELAKTRPDPVRKSDRRPDLIKKLAAEAVIQDLPSNERNALYLRTVRNQGPGAIPNSPLDAYSAAIHGLREGTPGMAQAVRERAQREPRFDSGPVDVALTLRQVLDSPRPLEGLLGLVRCGVKADLSEFLPLPPDSEPPCTTPDDPVRVHALALEALREISRLGSAEASERLNRLRLLYAPLISMRSAEYEGKVTAFQEAKGRGEAPFFDEKPPAVAPTGLALSIVETIEELTQSDDADIPTGRAAMRKAVARAERKLFEEGRLRKEEMVSEGLALQSR